MLSWILASRFGRDMGIRLCSSITPESRRKEDPSSRYAYPIHPAILALKRNPFLKPPLTRTLQTTNAAMEKVFKVNLISHFVLIREFLPGMLKQQKGHIVTMASMASFAAGAGLLDYCCSKVGALFLTEGIRAECLARYPGGEAICTTSVHPSWHATGIMGDESWTKLKKMGIKVDPPTNVSRVVVEQVLKGKSGRLYVPEGQKWLAGNRSWPLWVQDLVKGDWRGKRRAGFRFDSEQQSVQ